MLPSFENLNNNNVIVMYLKPFHRTNYNVNSKITTLSAFGSLYCLRKLSEPHVKNTAIARTPIPVFQENLCYHEFLTKLCYVIVTICSIRFSLGTLTKVENFIQGLSAHFPLYRSREN